MPKPNTTLSRMALILFLIALTGCAIFSKQSIEPDAPVAEQPIEPDTPPEQPIEPDTPEQPVEPDTPIAEPPVEPDTPVAEQSVESVTPIVEPVVDSGAPIVEQPIEIDNLPFQFEIVDNMTWVDFDEPSGIVFHPQRGTLFVVGDEGDVGEIKPNGKLLKQAWLGDADFEGITVDPSSGLLYISIEGAGKIVEIDPHNFKALRVFISNYVFEGKRLVKPSKDRVEGITFVPDSSHQEGGTFYLASQGWRIGGKKDSSVIFQVELPLKDNTAEKLPAKIIGFFPLDVIDLSGLYYNPASNTLFVISDTANLLMEITKSGDILRFVRLPGDEQEGVTLDKQGFLYIAQDSGGILKFKRNGQK